MNNVRLMLVCLFLLPMCVAADDTLESILQRMRATSITRISYQETRYMALFSEPWHGKGYLYALPPDTLIKEQLSPHRELMGASADWIYYYHPEKNRRYQAEFEDKNPISLNIAAFKALVNGDQQLLQRLYETDITQYAASWRLSLLPRFETPAVLKIVISGSAGQVADSINVLQKDGDRSEYRLEQGVMSQTLTATALQLKKELMQK